MNGALEIRDELGIISGMSVGDLEARILEGERAQASAPPDVSSQLRLTAQAEADALAQSADAQARHDQAAAAGASALARHLAAIDAGEPWPAAPSPDHMPDDDRTARLEELLARADQAAQRVTAREAVRQASSQNAARIEREA